MHFVPVNFDAERRVVPPKLFLELFRSHGEMMPDSRRCVKLASVLASLLDPFLRHCVFAADGFRFADPFRGVFGGGEVVMAGIDGAAFRAG